MGGPLETQDQEELEELVLQLLASRPVREARAGLLEAYRADPIAGSESARSTLEAAVDSVVASASSEAAVLDPTNPRLFWMACARHTWATRSFPNTGYGIENPDNVYRHGGIDDEGTFVIEGRFGPGRPMDMSFVVYGEVPGTGAMAKEGAPILGVLGADGLDIDDDGSFSVVIGPGDVGDRATRFETAPGARLLIVRESLSDWNTEMPSELRISRRSASTSSAPAFDDVAMLAADFAAKLGRYWGLDYNHAFIYPREVNRVGQPNRRGIGFATSGHFDLRDGEALIVTIEPRGARYIGFQLADPWGVAVEYVDRTGSLNLSQAMPNADGSITYVIAADDPGVHNWLDTSGLTSGMFAIRWQPVPIDEVPDGAVRSAALVPFDRVDAVLGPDAVRVDADQRARQGIDRARAYERRYR